MFSLLASATQPDRTLFLLKQGQAEPWMRAEQGYGQQTPHIPPTLERPFPDCPAPFL